jgi:hypothetical protein
MSRYPFDHENDGPDDDIDANEYVYGPSLEPMSEDQRIELWHLDQFAKLEFSGEQIALLLEWGVEPVEARKLMLRDGKRTKCTHDQALAILEPCTV